MDKENRRLKYNFGPYFCLLWSILSFFCVQ